MNRITARGYDEPLRVWEEEEGGWWLPIRGGRGETRGEWKVLTPPYKSSGGAASSLGRNLVVAPRGFSSTAPSPRCRLPLQSFAHRMSPSPLVVHGQQLVARRVKNSNSFLLLPLSSSPVILQFPSSCLHLDIITLPDVNLCRAPGMATRFFPKKISREKNRGVLRSCGGIEGGGGVGEGWIFFENFGEWRSVFLVSNMGFFSKNLANYFFPMGISGDRYFWFRM